MMVAGGNPTKLFFTCYREIHPFFARQLAHRKVGTIFSHSTTISKLIASIGKCVQKCLVALVPA